MNLSTRRMATLEQVRAFDDGSAPVDYKPLDRASTYAFVEDTLRRFAYRHLGKVDKGMPIAVTILGSSNWEWR